MCEAVTAAVVIGLASTGAQMIQADRVREEQQEFQMQQMRRARENAIKQARISIAQITAQQVADEENARVEVENNRRASTAAMATATVVAGESGAFGRNYQALLGDFAQRQAEFEAAVNLDLGVRRTFARLGTEQANLNQAVAIANAMRPPIPRPNYANFAIQGLGTGLSVYNAWTSAAGAPGTVPSGTSTPNPKGYA